MHTFLSLKRDYRLIMQTLFSWLMNLREDGTRNVIRLGLTITCHRMSGMKYLMPRLAGIERALENL
nr:MAG TPA: hypothetical protein [Bacteriophage sp.]